MINFTDKRVYAKGLCMAQLADPVSGEIIWSSNKFQSGNINFSANTDPLRAGLGNGIATIIATDSDTTVDFTRADFDLIAKMAAVGGTVFSPSFSSAPATARRLSIFCSLTKRTSWSLIFSSILQCL